MLRLISADDGFEMKLLRLSHRFPVEIKEGISDVDLEGATTRNASVIRSKHLETGKRYATFVAQIIGKWLSKRGVLKCVPVDRGIGSANTNKISHWYITAIRNPEHLGIGIRWVQKTAFLN